VALQSSGVRLPRIQHPADHPLMTVQKAAEALGCSDMTIRRRIAARQFPAIKNGRKSMVPRSFVERLIALAESGRTVVLDEVVTEWSAQADADVTHTARTQMSPGGIAARRGDASVAPGEELSTQIHGIGGWLR
jgi:excisionase family DNA binding protein